MLIQYLKNGEYSPTGSTLQIIDTKSSGNEFTYTIHSMSIDFASGISIAGTVAVRLVDSNIQTASSFTLLVTNNVYRKIDDFTVHTAATATENGAVKQGYVGEFDLFVQMFGHNTFNQPNAIFPFIVDAIQRKFNLV